MDTVEYLGFILSPEGLKMDQTKVTTIQAWPVIACRSARMGQYTQGPNQVNPDVRTNRNEERGYV